MSTKIMIIFGAEDHKMYQILVPMNPTKKMSAKWEVVALGSLTLSLCIEDNCFGLIDKQALNGTNLLGICQ